MSALTLVKATELVPIVYWSNVSPLACPNVKSCVPLASRRTTAAKVPRLWPLENPSAPIIDPALRIEHRAVACPVAPGLIDRRQGNDCDALRETSCRACRWANSASHDIGAIAADDHDVAVRLEHD